MSASHSFAVSCLKPIETLTGIQMIYQAVMKQNISRKENCIILQNHWLLRRSQRYYETCDYCDFYNVVNCVCSLRHTQFSSCVMYISCAIFVQDLIDLPNAIIYSCFRNLHIEDSLITGLNNSNTKETR